MQGQNHSVSFSGAAQHVQPKPLRVLVVDGAPDVYAALTRCTCEHNLSLTQVDTIAQARRHLATSQVDVALIELNLPDGSGVELARELGRDDRATQTIVLNSHPTYHGAVDALRAGVKDMIAKPLDYAELVRCLRRAKQRHQCGYQLRRRLRRLRRVCRKLNHMRKDVKQQVDILCQDLVAAYQELAVQMNQVVQTSEFAGVIRQELDLEQLLCKTLEFILQKAGPTNAAVFLPANSDEYTLGGYVNYNRSSDSAEILLQHLADVVAPRVAEYSEPIHITDNETLTGWIGADVAYLRDNHVITFTCRHDDETLAIVMLFRDGSEPFEEKLTEICESISPLLGDYLAKLIRIHHRYIDSDDAAEDEDYFWGNAA